MLRNSSLVDHKKTEESMFFISLFFSLLIFSPVFSIVLRYKFSLNDFSDRIISPASAANLDISSRINSYYTTIILFFCCFIFLYFLLRRLIKKNATSLGKSQLNFTKNISIIGVLVVISSLFSAQLESGLYVLGSIVLLFFFNFIFKKNTDVTLVLFSSCLSIVISIYLLVTSMKIGLFQKISSIDAFNKIPISTYDLMFSGSFFVVLFGIYTFSSFCIKYYESKGRLRVAVLNIVGISLLPLLSSALLQSIFLELMNILDKRWNIFVGRPYFIYTLTIFVLTLVAFIIFAILSSYRGKAVTTENRKILGIYFVITLVTIGLLTAQPARLASVGNEFFEMANHGLSVDHWFRYHSIPIVENFDAHMLSQQIFAYVYSYLNGYEPWAAFLYDNYIQVFYMLLLYYFLNLILGRISSFFIVLTFPLLYALFQPVFIVPIAMVYVLKKLNNEIIPIKNYYLFWIVAFLLCFYRLDVGVASLVSGLFVISWLAVSRKKTLEFKNITVSGFVSGIVIGLIFVFLCFANGINPLNRFLEFVRLAQSNQNWAYSSVGDNTLVAFVIGYFVLPLILTFLTLHVLYVSFKNKVRNNIFSRQVLFKNSLILYFFIFFIFNISRGMVRHSLFEGTLLYVVSTLSFVVMLLLYFYTKSQNRLKFFLVIALVVIIATNVNMPSLTGFTSTTAKAISSSNYFNQYEEREPLQNSRVYGEPPESAMILKQVLDSTLASDETYFDFSSFNYFYALTNRKNPVYVNQSPLLISGDTTQESAIEQLNSEKPSIVLMPIQGKEWSYIDGIATDYKYYKISEYIYSNYDPLIRLNDFDVYCLSDKKNEFKEKLKKNKLIDQLLMDKEIQKGDYDRLILNDLKIKESQEGILVLEPGDQDPYIENFWTGINEKAFEVSSSLPVQLRLYYRSSEEGTLQVFYKSNSEDIYTEDHSYTHALSKTSNGILNLDFSSMPYDIRIDLNGTEIGFEKVELRTGVLTLDTQPEVWSRGLGVIPYLWARDSDEEEINSALILKQKLEFQNLNISGPKTLQSQQTYLVMNIKSKVEQTVSMTLKDESRITVGEFNFQLLEGDHSYAVLVSSDYKWWTGVVDSIGLHANTTAEITGISYYMPQEKKVHAPEVFTF